MLLWMFTLTDVLMAVRKQPQRSSATLNICDRPWNGRPSVLLLLFTAQRGLKMNSVLLQPSTHHLCPDMVHKVSSNAGGKWVFKLKSRTDDNETVLGRNILVQINSGIHLIRLTWSMTHSFEWIQVIRLNLLPWNGNASLGTKSTH